MFTCHYEYFHKVTAAHYYTSKPFDSLEQAKAYAQLVIERAKANPDIVYDPSIFNVSVHQHIDGREYIVFNTNQRRCDFLNSIPTSGYTNMTSFE